MEGRPLIFLRLLLVLALLLVAGPALAAPAFDAASEATAGTGNLSWTHTPSGTPRGVKVYVSQDAAFSDQVSSVTYGGVGMTRIEFAARDGTEDGAVYLYFLGASIPTGAQTVSVTVSDAATKTAHAVTATASADTAVEDSSQTTGDAADPSLDVTTAGGLTTFCTSGAFSGVGAPSNLLEDTDMTRMNSHDFGVTITAWDRITTNPTGGTVNFSWTAVSNNFAIAAACIKEQAAAGAAAGGMLLLGVGR